MKMSFENILSYIHSPLCDGERSRHSEFIQLLNSIPTFVVQPRFTHGRGGFRGRGRGRGRGGGRGHFNRHKPQRGFGNTRPNAGAGEPNGFSRPVGWRQKMGGSAEYKSIFGNENDLNASEKHLNHIKDRLNKITEDNIDKLTKQILTNLRELEGEFIKKFVNEVFQRAATQPTFIEMYVKLLSNTLKIKPRIRNEINHLIRDFSPIFDIRLERISDEDYDKFCEMNKRKTFREGYSSFIVELVSVNMIDIDELNSIATNLFSKIYSQTQEDMSPNTKENLESMIACFRCFMFGMYNDEVYAEDDEFQDLVDDVKRYYTEFGKPILRQKIGMKSVFTIQDITNCLSNRN
jgi:hypothetical protein